MEDYSLTDPYGGLKVYHVHFPCDPSPGSLSEQEYLLSLNEWSTHSARNASWGNQTLTSDFQEVFLV